MRHRWMLAVPVALAVVGLTLREGVKRDAAVAELTAPVSDAWAAGFVQADPGAEYGVTEDGIDLRSGGVLAYVPGIAIVRLGGWKTIVWGGSVYVAAERNGVTVVAFDVPVIVEGDLGTAVIQPGNQWRSPTQALPDPLLDPVAWREAIRLTAIPEHFARERQETLDAWKAQDTASLVELSASILGSGTNGELARIALHAAPSKSLAAAIRSRAELRFYGLLQPSVRDMAWAYVPENATIDASTWMSLMLLPQIQGDASSALTARKWGEALSAALRASGDSAVASAVLTVLESDVLRIAADGYPLRALQFAQAVHAAFGSGAALSESASASLGRLSAMTPESLRASALSISALSAIGQLPAVTDLPPTPIPEPVIVIPDPALEAHAREQLAAKGAMFTGDSSIRTVAPGVVDVESVVFGFASGDRALRFRYMPAADTVQAVIDGAMQPYALPWQSYIDWEAGR